MMKAEIEKLDPEIVSYLPQAMIITDMAYEFYLEPNWVNNVYYGTCEETDTEFCFSFSSASNTLYIGFRGTEIKSWQDIVANLLYFKWFMKVKNPVPKFGLPFIMGHSGFIAKYKSIKNRIDDVVAKSNPATIVFTGHSQGAAIAQLAAVDYASNAGAKAKTMCICFASPRVFGFFSARKLKRLFPNWVNFIYHHDPVPFVPFPFMPYSGAFSHLNTFVVKPRNLLSILKLWTSLGCHKIRNYREWILELVTHL